MPSAAPRRALNLDRLWIDLQRSLGFVREGLEHCQSSNSFLGTSDNLAKCDATLVFATLRILGKEEKRSGPTTVARAVAETCSVEDGTPLTGGSLSALASRWPIALLRNDGGESSYLTTEWKST